MTHKVRITQTQHICIKANNAFFFLPENVLSSLLMLIVCLLECARYINSNANKNENSNLMNIFGSKSYKTVSNEKLWMWNIYICIEVCSIWIQYFYLLFRWVENLRIFEGIVIIVIIVNLPCSYMLSASFWQ